MVIKIDSETLRELLDKVYNYDKICDLFNVPDANRSNPIVHVQITERFKTYVTGYMGRKSLYERETRAAFEEPALATLPDPDFTGFKEPDDEKI